MSRDLELFIRSKTVKLPQVVTIGRPIGDHWCTVKQTYRFEKLISVEDERVKKNVHQVAREKGWKLKEYDLATMKGRLRAAFKGIKRTPTLIVSGRKIEGNKFGPELHDMLAD